MIYQYKFRDVFAIGLLLLCYCLMTQHAQAQGNEGEVIFTEEEVDSSDYAFKEKYNYLIRADKEELRLIKVALVRIPYLFPSVTYEHKLSPPVSVFGGIGITIGNFSVPDEGTQDPSFSIKSFLGVDFAVGARYYYNIKKRIRKGKSANNFSANYLGFENTFVIWTGDAPESVHYNTGLVFGIQRRLGDYGFVDFNLGPETVSIGTGGVNIQLGLSLKVGFAFSKI